MENPHQDPLKSAMVLHRAGEWTLAEQFYLEALADQPRDYDAKFNFATMLAANGRPAEAAVLFNEILAETPDDVDTLINLGNAYQHDGCYPDAEKCYLQALKKEPYLPQIHSNLGSLYQRQGDFESAIENHRASLDLDPFEIITLNNLGLAQMSLNRTDEANKSFQAALALDGDLPDTHKYLGNLMLSRGCNSEALDYLDRAVELAPDWPEAIAERGLAKQRNNDHEAAIEDFKRACQLSPEFSGAWLGLADACTNSRRFEEADTALRKAEEHAPGNGLVAVYKGNLAHELGDTAEALKQFAKACEIDPQEAQYHMTYGTALLDESRFKESIEALLRAVELNPNSAEATNNLGNAYNNLGRHEDAIRYFEQAIEIGGPTTAMAACNLGNVLREIGELDGALKNFDLAKTLNPKLSTAHNGTGLVLQMLNRFEEAILAYEQALAIEPDYVEAVNNLGVAYMDTGKLTKAAEAFNRLLDLRPDMPQPMFNLGTLLQGMDKWDESIIVLSRLVQVEPENTKTYPYLAHALMQQCNWSNLNATVSHIKQNIIDDLDADRTVSVTAFALQAIPGDFSMELRRRVAENLAREVELSIKELRREISFEHPRKRRRKRLRIGYISPDFRFHSVAVAFKGILFSHDKERFEIYGYALPGGGKVDTMTEELAGQFDVFRFLEGLSFKDGAQLIYDDEIDILIDLAGYTRGSKPQFLAMRPAAIQAHYLGYSTTLGANFLDYIITDRLQFGEHETGNLTEQPVFLPHTFMSTQQAPVALHRPTREDAGLPTDALVMANFNGHYKFDPEMFSIWMRLMRRNREAVLWLGKGTEGSRKNLQLEAESRGVSPDRLIFAEIISHPEHLARLPLADLALDNQYHGGGVTTVDCLWMGVPVITMAGKTPQSRNGATLLAAIGMEELITYNPTEYEKRVAELVTDREKRKNLSQTIMQNQSTEPLFNGALLTRHLESAYEMMWQNYEDGNDPRPISVPSIIN